MVRKPKGYIGLRHETIGSDILSTVKVLNLPERTLGKELAAELAKVKPDQWYPIDLLFRALDAMEQKLDAYALRSVGWAIIKSSHEQAIRENFKNARDLLGAFDAIYRNANRGEAIGGWKMLSFTPQNAVLEKTTPHLCIVEEGILEEALRTIGVASRVQQTECFRKGADACIYELTPTLASTGWTG